MTFADGLELANNELAFAEHQNVELMGARGNQVITGVGVTPQGTPDLTVAVASGTVLAGGVVVAVTSGNIDFSTEHGALTSGQAQFGFIHVNSSGTKSKTMGTAATAGQQLPADVPEDEVVLAQITLTEGDPTIDSVDIEDWRINVPKGGYTAGQSTIAGVLNLTGLGTTIGQGFLARHTTGGVITYRTFAQVLSDISGQAQDNFLDDLAGLTQGTDKIPYMTSTTTAALLNFRDEDDFASDDALGLASQQSIKAYVDALELVGVANAEYISLSFTHLSLNTIPEVGYWLANGNFTSLVNVDGTDFTSIWHLTGVPYEKGGLTLRISGARVTVEGANATNQLTTIVKFGLTSTGTVSIDTDVANIQSPQVNVDAFTKTTIGGVYEMVAVSCVHNVADANVLKLMSVELLCHYE